MECKWRLSCLRASRLFAPFGRPSSVALLVPAAVLVGVVKYVASCLKTMLR